MCVANVSTKRTCFKGNILAESLGYMYYNAKATFTVKARARKSQVMEINKDLVCGTKRLNHRTCKSVKVVICSKREESKEKQSEAK